MSTQMQTIESSVLAVMPECKDLVKTHKAIDINAEQNYAIQQLYKNDFNVKVALANPVSVQNAVRNLSSIGISLNPALRHAYLVPRDGAICLDVSYMGLMHLAQQDGAILWGQAKIVYSNDTYTNNGASVEPTHKYSPFGDRGEKIGCYCVVKLPNGDFLTEEMSAKQVYEVRDTSKAWQSTKRERSPWATFEEEMWRKTVVKRASKYWPKTGNSRFDEAVHVVNEHEGIEEPQEFLDSIQKLEKYASDEHTPIELYGFLEWFRNKHGEDAFIGLFNRFPAGKKVSGKQKYRDGQSQFADYIEIFKGDDESAIDEAKEELTEMELQMIEKAVAK